MRGTFIVLEGGEGAGKGAVRKFLETEFPDAVFTREPGGTPLAEKIRAVMISPEATNANAQTQMALVFASRLEHVRAKILPALQAGKAVISERFDSSTYAYQIHGQEAPYLKPLFTEFRKLLGETVPDLYIFLDVDAAVGLTRVIVNKKKEPSRTTVQSDREPLDHFEKRSLAFHERVRMGYAEFFKTVPHVIVDASRPLEVVQSEVSAIIRKCIRL